MKFPNLEYTRPKLPADLVCNYKRSMHEKEGRELSTKDINQLEISGERNQQVKLRAAIEENLQNSIRNLVIFIVLLFSCSLLNHGNVFDG